MDEQFNGERKLRIQPPERIVQFGSVVLVMLALFLAAQSIKTFKEFHYIGSGVTASNTITVSGSGDVFAVPDTGTFSVTVQEEAKDVATAQAAATKKSNDIIAYLKAQNVEEKDIKTTDYSVNPQYDYINGTCSSGYCPPGKQTLRGYQVTQTLEVKVRDTKKAGDLLSGVGGKGASQVSGLSFTTDDPDALQAEARSKAITDAKTKADELAKELGVKIVRVVGFNEDGGGRPIYYAKNMAVGMGGAMDSAAPAPELPVGQNKITSNVSVTYEIR